MSDKTDSKSATAVERKSDREVMVTRSFDAPVHIVFEAWTNSQLFEQWWVPKSYGLTLLSCELDVRVGGKYRLEFGHPASEQPMAFFGTYTEVIPNSRIVWTNEESEDGAVTTVTFEQQANKTVLIIHDLYPSIEALEASGASDGMHETLDQLAAFIGNMVRP